MNRSNAAACAASLVVCLWTNVGMVRAQAVPEPWSSRDIGGPMLGGSSSYSNGVLRVDAAGEDVWGTADQFHFVYQALSGDADIRARVDSVTMAHVWSKAGVMIRSSLAAGAAHGYVVVSAGKGTAFQRRAAQGGITTSTAGPNVTPPRWVRIARVGTRVTAYTSIDGNAWAALATDTVALGSTVYVGIAVTSHHPGMRTSAAVSMVNLNASAPPPIEQALPAGQTNTDIGGPAIAGSVLYSGGQYTIRGSGTDIWGSHDQFHYVYQPVTGDVDVKARVASLTAVDTWAKAGVMIRESLSPGSRHALAVTSPGKGYAFQRRVETGAWSEHTSGGAGTAPGWVRLVRKGTVVSAFRSADGVTWTSMGSDTIAMAETVYVGLAVTSHSVSAATTAVIDGLRITVSAESSANMPPAVVLSSPANGTTYTAPVTVTLTASATDPDGTIAAVEFYVNGTLFGRDTAAPYTMTGSPAAGSYSITAVATDTKGASATSSTVTVTVKAGAVPVGAPRLVAFTASATHALVVRYVLEVYGAGATPGVSSPVATSDLGKPAPASNGDISVDRATFFAALPAGNYVAAVVAVGSSATARSASITFTR